MIEPDRHELRRFTHEVQINLLAYFVIPLYLVGEGAKARVIVGGEGRILLCLSCLVTLGNSRKYPYHTTDGFHILTPPCFQNFQNALSPPMPPIPPLRFGFSIFLSNPSELPAGFANMPNLAYFTENYFK